MRGSIPRLESLVHVLVIFSFSHPHFPVDSIWFHQVEHGSTSLLILEQHTNQIWGTSSQFLSRLGLQPVLLHQCYSPRLYNFPLTFWSYWVKLNFLTKYVYPGMRITRKNWTHEIKATHSRSHINSYIVSHLTFYFFPLFSTIVTSNYIKYFF